MQYHNAIAGHFIVNYSGASTALLAIISLLSPSWLLGAIKIPLSPSNQISKYFLHSHDYVLCS